MKNFFKLLVALALTFTAAAQVTISGTLSAASNNVVVTVPCTILSFTICDTSGTNNALVIYDTTSLTSTNTVRAAYTSVVQYPTNRITLYTNALGVSTTYTNTVMYRANVSTAATTNEANRVYTTLITASDCVTPPETVFPLGASRGLAIRPANAGVYTLTYVPQF